MRRRYLNALKLDALAVVVGVLGGLAAVAFRVSVDSVSWAFTMFKETLVNLGVPAWLAIAIAPAVGGLIVAPIVSSVPEARGSGIPGIMEAMALRGGRIRLLVVPARIAASSITIGSGGSAGREGPIAHIGAALGSSVAQFMKLPPHDVKVLTVAGLAAGVAGTFNSPLGGALFGIEVLTRILGPLDAVPVVLASVVGAATSTYFLGETPFVRIPYLPGWKPEEIPLYAALGVAMGLLAALWARVFHTLDSIVSRATRVSMVAPAAGGLAAGLVASLYPQGGISGVGYEALQRALEAAYTPVEAASLAAAKLAATTFTLALGGSGGLFSPSLYAGGMLGLSIASILRDAGFEVDTLGFTLAGMAAFFAAISQAPITMSIMIPEISGGFSLIPPIMASCSTASATFWLAARGRSLFTMKLEMRGLKVRMLESVILDSVQAGEVAAPASEAAVRLGEKAGEALERLERSGYKYRFAPALDPMGRVVGVVDREKLSRHPSEPVDRLVLRGVYVYSGATVARVVEVIERLGVDSVPVADWLTGRLVGVIGYTEVLRAIEIAMEREEGGG